MAARYRENARYKGVECCDATREKCKNTSELVARAFCFSLGLPLMWIPESGLTIQMLKNRGNCYFRSSDVVLLRETRLSTADEPTWQHGSLVSWSFEPRTF